jgi:hypothetical protein
VNAGRAGSGVAAQGGARGPDGRVWPGIRGLFGRAYIDLGRYLDLGELPAIHEEVCLALAQIPLDVTGGSHRSMGIMPPSRAAEAMIDYGEVIRAMSGAELAALRSLADDPRAWEGVDPESGDFGEERRVPLSRRQLAWLKVRFGVYFPWKGYVELIPNRSWGDKSSSAGKRFTRVAEAFFPRTIAFVRSLPFVEIGRCNVMGLEALDHGTVHRDGEPEEQGAPDHFVTFVPGGDKRVFLWDEAAREELAIEARAYWFNDFDYHGVSKAERFRYSIRVDGVFEPAFLSRIERDAGVSR